MKNRNEFNDLLRFEVNHLGPFAPVTVDKETGSCIVVSF